MKFYVLASVIIFILVITRNIKKNSKLLNHSNRSFWERERRANSVRRKSLEHLNYIQIPLESLPTHLMTDDDKVAECLEYLQNLSTQSIVNFTGYTNTDLKLEYGAANISQLTAYDQNYTLLARTLQQWAEALYRQGYVAEARQILEFAIQTDTDVSRSYLLLAEIYHSQSEDTRINDLLTHAKDLRSPHKVTIVRMLQEAYPSIG